MPHGETIQVDVDGIQLSLSNLAKPMYPTGFTKGEVIDYYRRIAPFMLPHVRGRALTRIRYPHGVGDTSFFEKRKPPSTPEWVHTANQTHKEETVEFVVADDRATLVWLANLAALELHPQLHLAVDQDAPTLVVFDLDPGAPAALLECCEVALWIRQLAEDLGLQVFPKVSGGKGMQLYLPLNTPCTYDQTKAFSRGVALLLEREHPGEVVHKMAKDLRKGKVLIDWSQNDPVKTTVAAYSLRAQPRPTVSAPLAWREVEEAMEAKDAGGLVFEAPEVLVRVEEHGDLFAPVARLKQRLPALG